MFPQINSIFRSKNKNEIPNFETPINRNPLFENNLIVNTSSLIARDDNYIISKPIDKANCLAKYFADINNVERNSASQRLEEIINLNFIKYKGGIVADNMRGEPVVAIDSNNKTNKPTYVEDTDFFVIWPP